MSDDRGHAVPPPIDLATRTLPLGVVAKGTRWWRVHRSVLGPCHFSESRANRFSSDGLGALYLADRDITAFWEVYWDDLATRPPDQRRIARAKVDERSVCRVTVVRDLSVFDATDDASLLAVSAPTATFSSDYGTCQAWAVALAAHPSKPSGIKYRSARQASGVCAAFFALRAACDDFRFGPSKAVGASTSLVKKLEQSHVKILADHHEAGGGQTALPRRARR